MNINTLEVETVELHDVRIRPEEAIPVHTQNTWEFNLILKGHGTRTIGGRSEPFRAGDFVVVPPKMPHGWCYDPKSAGRDKMVKNIALFVNPNWLKKAAKIFPTLTLTLKAFLARTTAFTLSPEKEAEMTDFLRGLVSVDNNLLPLATLEFIHCLEQSAGICPLTDATTPQAKEKELIMHLRAYISSNYMRKISLSSAARHAGMSRAVFVRSSKKQPAPPLCTPSMLVASKKRAGFSPAHLTPSPKSPSSSATPTAPTSTANSTPSKINHPSPGVNRITVSSIKTLLHSLWFG